MTALQVTRCPYVPLVLLLLGTSWTLLHPASAYPVGPPTSACETMTPEHEVAAQSSDSPYTITLSSTSYTPGEPLTGRSTTYLNNLIMHSFSVVHSKKKIVTYNYIFALQSSIYLYYDAGTWPVFFYSCKIIIVLFFKKNYTLSVAWFISMIILN